MSRSDRGTLRQWLLAATDPVAPAALSRRAWWVVSGIILLLLLPSLLHPLGADQALFYVTGRKLLDGAILYRDAVDIKPPLIYYLYSLTSVLFGGGSLSIRIFDVVMQGAACVLMITLIRRARGGDLMAALAPVCYLFLYFAQGYQYTAQSEGFASLFSILLLSLLLFRRSRAGFFIAGIVCGALFLLKFTFGVILAAAIVGEILLYRSSLGSFARHALLLVSGFAAVLLLFALYLAVGHALHDFALVSSFTSEYAKIELRSPMQWFKNLISLPAFHFADNYSIILMLATVAGVARALLRSGASAEDERGIDLTRLLRFAVIAFVLLFLTIVIEGKYPPYHYMRLYPFGAILAAAGIVGALRLCARRLIVERYILAIALPLLGAIILYGPFIRYIWHALLPAKARFDNAAVVRFINPEPYSQEAFMAMGDYIRAEADAGDELFAMSSQAALIYHHADILPAQRIFHSAFVIAPFAPNEWRDSTRAYLLREEPAIIVLDTGDNLPGITGTTLTSSMAIAALPGVSDMLATRYRRETRPVAPMFEIYRRR